MRTLYSLVTCLIAVISYPVGLLLALLGRPLLLERLKPPSNSPQGGSVRLWIHAASMGEAGIAFSMAEEVKKTYPGSFVFISTVTSTGLARVRAMNESSKKNIVDCSFLSPIDCYMITRGFVRKVRPTSLILVETEIWPSLIQAVHNEGVPITIINGKLSRRAFRRYMFFRFAIKEIVRNISLVCVQSRSFSKRFSMLGVPRERIEIIGNIKFDSLPDPSDYKRETLRREMGIPLNANLFVAGSTRPGEEEVLVKSFTQLLKKKPDAVMILAPRHLKRVPVIEKIFQDNGLPFVTRSSGDRIDGSNCRALILDTMGELVSAYACADVAFVGGSITGFGGHNPLEPASLGVPVLFGPYMEQIGSKELLSEGSAALVHDEDELAAIIISIINDSEKKERMGNSGTAVVRRFQGTLERTLQCMKNRDLI